MNILTDFFGGNLSLSLILELYYYWVRFYIIIRLDNVKLQKVLSFNLWYTLMSFGFLGIVILFCVYVLRLH